MMDRGVGLGRLPQMPEVELAAPAKINLHLEILGRDGRGFHVLETVFQTLELADTVRVAHDPGGSGTRLEVRGCPGLDAGSGNLAWRAAEVFRGLRPDLGRVAITLVKRLPLGGGLGGGSSDAAAVLRALSRMHPAPPTPCEIEVLAAGLGSDVPFFLRGGTVWATGRGIELAPLADLPPRPVWLLLPPCACPTPAVFAALTEAERGPRTARGAAHFAAGDAWLAQPHNRLAAASRRAQPALAPWLDWAGASGVPCILCGSGSTIAFFAEPPAPPPGARLIATRFRPRNRD